jgi:protein disulfide-isomerase A6
MWGWVWAEAGAQSDVEEALNIGGFGYPAMAAVNTRKMKFSLLKGSFSEKGLNEFLLEVAVGRSSTEPIKAGQLPKVTSIEAWDGKDAELPPEEDIDLDDVFDDVDNKKTEL